MSSSISNNRYGTIDPTVVEAFESLSFDSEDDNNSISNSNTTSSNNIIKSNKKIQNSTVFNKMKRAVSSLPAIAVILSFSIIAAFLLIKSEYNISIFKASNQSFKIDTTTPSAASNLRSSSRGIGAAPSVIATAPSASSPTIPTATIPTTPSASSPTIPTTPSATIPTATIPTASVSSSSESNPTVYSCC